MFMLDRNEQSDVIMLLGLAIVDNFRYGENLLSFVFKQPDTPEEIERCQQQWIAARSKRFAMMEN